MKFTPNSFLLFFSLMFVASCKGQTLEIKERNINPIVSLQKQAYYYYNVKQYGKSIKIYGEILTLARQDVNKYDEDIAWAYYETGFCFLVQKKFNEAAPYFKKVLDSYSSYPDVYTLARDRIEEIRIRSLGKITLETIPPLKDPVEIKQ